MIQTSEDAQIRVLGESHLCRNPIMGRFSAIHSFSGAPVPVLSKAGSSAGAIGGASFGAVGQARALRAARRARWYKRISSRVRDMDSTTWAKSSYGRIVTMNCNNEF